MRLHFAALAAAALLTATLGGCATAYDDGAYGYGHGYGYGSQGYSHVDPYGYGYGYGYGYPFATRHYDSRIYLYSVAPHRGVVHGGRHHFDRDRAHHDWRHGDHRRADRAWRDRDEVRHRDSRDDRVHRGARLDDGRAAAPVRTRPERVEPAARPQPDRQRVREESRPVPEAAVVNPRHRRGAHQAVQDDAPEDWWQIERPAGPRQQSQR
ncbi:MAG TPA: hypothetical protein VMM59_07045 [Thermohalobaculum sp.]|nr:hypothetical protein [Thermohalobaculum sp.]